MNPLKVVIYGSKGRMGQALVALAKENTAFDLIGTIDDGESLDPIASCDAVIDFTHADATLPALQKCIELGKIIVIGTTGHSNDVRQAITEASAKIPVIFSPNYSVGVNTLFWLTKKAAEILGPGKILAVEQKVTIETDPAKARALGRKELSRYMVLPNYRNNWLRIGFSEADLADGGSDTFIDAMCLWGDAATVKKGLRAHFDAGATHVCLQPVHADGDFAARDRMLAALADT